MRVSKFVFLLSQSTQSDIRYELAFIIRQILLLDLRLNLRNYPVCFLDYLPVSSMSPASKFDLAETDSKEVLWWDPEIGNRLPPQVRHFFEDYSGIPEDQLLSHLHEIVRPLLFL